MSWAWWLAPPVLAGLLAALRAWWSGWRAARPAAPGTDAAMRSHRDYLAALTHPARGTARVVRDDV